ncbi:peptidoglycan recognition protein [Streptomyces sp. GC420]|uniref:peptidoglycan recognition protein family protein n=1 Tax=Streptomyces sp. GC420 TaxID=2697568 RepID=UPI0014151585|nr:peptidoglycan recognition protein [Streptomyces sp. GC420]NBM20421.1 N-acetylmuramoyl-L-alanine amidase [Streptomyces sp. GC420]
MRLSRAALYGAPAVLALALLATPPGEPRAEPGRLPQPSPAVPPAAPHTLNAARGRIPGPGSVQPLIVSRERWLGSAARPQPAPRYSGRVTAVFIHHTDTPNSYDCADVPHTLRNLYEGQAGARHWDDIGYNFLVDRCGTVYEGRAGGVTKPVVGAHTQGFNHGTTGIAAIGTFTAGTPVPTAMTDAIARLVAWKLSLAGIDPRGRVSLVSTHGLSRFAAGERAVMDAVSGHIDAFETSCPGAALLERLPAIRQQAAEIQGRNLAVTRTAAPRS